MDKFTKSIFISAPFFLVGFILFLGSPIIGGLWVAVIGLLFIFIGLMIAVDGS